MGGAYMWLAASIQLKREVTQVAFNDHQEKASEKGSENDEVGEEDFLQSDRRKRGFLAEESPVR